MKVVLVLCLTLGTAFTVSRPYKPQAWRPGGHAFTLPGEHESLQVKKTKQDRNAEDLKEYAPQKPKTIESLASEQEISELHKDSPINKTKFEEIRKEAKSSESISAEDNPTTEMSDLNTLALANLDDDSSVEIQAVNITETQLNNMAEILDLISEEKNGENARESAEKRAQDDSGSLEGFFEYGLPSLPLKYSPPKEPQF